MNELDIKKYIDLSDFLGTVLGPDYEIIVYDLKQILYIINGNISGRKSGDLLSPTMKSILQREESAKETWLSNYRALSSNGKILRSSSFFIKDESCKVVGGLNINFDDNRYKELSNLIFSLCHPDNYVSKNICIVVWNKLITYMQTIRYMMTIKIKPEKKNVMNPSHLTRKIS